MGIGHEPKKESDNSYVGGLDAEKRWESLVKGSSEMMLLVSFRFVSDLFCFVSDENEPISSVLLFLNFSMLVSHQKIVLI